VKTKVELPSETAKECITIVRALMITVCFKKSCLNEIRIVASLVKEKFILMVSRYRRLSGQILYQCFSLMLATPAIYVLFWPVIIQYKYA